MITGPVSLRPSQGCREIKMMCMHDGNFPQWTGHFSYVVNTKDADILDARSQGISNHGIG